MANVLLTSRSLIVTGISKTFQGFHMTESAVGKARHKPQQNAIDIGCVTEMQFALYNMFQ